MCSFRSTYALSNIFLLNFYAINFTINNINVKKKKFNEACVTKTKSIVQVKTNIYFGVENTYTCTSQQREREGKRKRTVMHTSEAGLITRFPLRYFTPFPSV